MGQESFVLHFMEKISKLCDILNEECQLKAIFLKYTFFWVSLHDISLKQLGDIRSDGGLNFIFKDQRILSQIQISWKILSRIIKSLRQIRKCLCKSLTVSKKSNF